MRWCRGKVFEGVDMTEVDDFLAWVTAHLGFFGDAYVLRQKQLGCSSTTVCGMWSDVINNPL